MNVTLTKEGAAAVITVRGRLDTMSAPELEQKLTEWISGGSIRLILDLAGLEYISSAGLRILLSAAKKASAQGGFLSCCALQGIVRKVFDVSDFSRILPVYDTLDEALSQH